MKENHPVYKAYLGEIHGVIAGRISESNLRNKIRDLQLSTDEDIQTIGNLLSIHLSNTLKFYPFVTPLNVSYWKAMKVITQEEWDLLKKISCYDLRGGDYK